MPFNGLSRFAGDQPHPVEDTVVAFVFIDLALPQLGRMVGERAHKLIV